MWIFRWTSAFLVGCAQKPPGDADSDPVACEQAHVLAYHYGWYGTPEGSGDWRHWNDASHDPDALAADGRPDIAAAHDPLGGAYDSQDPSTVRRQIDDSSAAGLDGFVVSWWGEGSFEDAAIRALADEIEGSGSPLRFAVYYEVVPEEDPDRAIEEITYLRTAFFERESYFRIQDEPVLLVYGRAVFPGVYCLFEDCPEETPDTVDWSPVLASVEADGPLSVWADVVSNAMFPENMGLVAEMGFDGAHVYNPHVEVMAGVDMAAFQAQLVGDSHAAALAAAATVIPGYDDTALDRPGTTSIPRDGGALYRAQWQAAIDASPDLFLLTSYNEWHEGTEIEPSVEDGDTYLQLTAELLGGRACERSTE